MTNRRRMLCVGLVILLAASGVGFAEAPAADAVTARAHAAAAAMSAQRSRADALEAAGRHDDAAEAYEKLSAAYSARGEAATKDATALKAAGQTDAASAKLTEAQTEYGSAADLSEKAASILLKQLDAATPAAADAPKVKSAPPTFTPPAAPAVAPPLAAPTGTPLPAAQIESPPPAPRTGFAVGERIQYLLGKTWFEVTVAKVEGDKYVVHCEGRTKSKYETWDRPATLDQLRAVPVIAAAPAMAGEKGLDGIYLQTVPMNIGGRFSVEVNHYWFRPDGNLYLAIPPGGLADPNAFAALLKRDVKRCATYGIVGNQITIQVSGQKPQQYGLTNEGNGAVLTWSGPAAIRVGTFVENQKLDARYGGGASAGGGGAAVSVAAGMTFHADGTYESSRIASIDSTGQRVSVGTGAEGSSRGTYQLSGNTLALTGAAGKTASFTVYPKPDADESPPARICIDGLMYKLEAAR